MQFQNHDKEEFWDALGGEGLVVSGSWGSRGCGCLRGGGVSYRIGVYCRYVCTSIILYYNACDAVLIGKVLLARYYWQGDNAITAISDAI